MNKYTNKLFCFSPPVMVATFLIELSLLIYTVVRYKMSTATRLAAAILFFLALFQLAEFGICGKTVDSAHPWSRIGFIAITTLPPLGIHLTHAIAKKKAGLITWLAYLSGMVFVLIFGLRTSAFAGQMCTSNYAIFSLVKPYNFVYYVYYFLLIYIAIGFCFTFSQKADNKTKTALYFQIVGYLSFVVPTGIVNAINPQTMNGIPSIMCGFAILYALILVFGIIPKIATKKSA